jgi:hypothetical protein
MPSMKTACAAVLACAACAHADYTNNILITG